MRGHDGPRRRPPRLAEYLIAAALPRSEREALLGDLEETFARRRRHGRFKAAIWYWAQVIATPVRVAYEGRAGLSSILPDRRLTRGFESLSSSIRLGARRALQRPGPLLGVVTVLSLAIGGSTALFAALDSLRRWEPGLPAPDQISALSLHSVRQTTARLAYDQALRIVDALPDVSTAMVAHPRVVARTDAGATTVLSAVVTPGFFDVVDAPLARGRPLSASGNEVVVSDRFRRGQLADRDEVLGTPLWVNGDPYTIVGVAADGFRGLSGRPSLWLPIDVVPPAEHASLRVSLLACRCDHPDLEATASRVAAALDEPAADAIDAAWRPAEEVWVPADTSTRINRTNLIVATLALLVLVAACANVANLMLADGLGRRDEMVVRSAIGASRGQLLRQLVMESALIAAAVCAGSYLVAITVLAAVPRWLPTATPGFEQTFELPSHLLAAAIGLALGVTLLASLMPAWRVAGTRSAGLSAHSPDGRRGRLLEILGGAQLAAAVALTLISLMLGGGMDEIHDQPLGYEESNRYSFTFDASAVPDDGETRPDVYRRFFAELGAHPAVEAAGIAGAVPGFLGPNALLTVRPDETPTLAAAMGIGPGYLEAMGTRVVEGRALRPDDAGRDVAVVSESLARELWEAAGGPTSSGCASPIGETVRVGNDDNALRIVGVVEDGTYAGREILPVLLRPLPPGTSSRALVVVHARDGLANLNGAIRGAARAAHADLSNHSLAPVSEWFDRHWVLNRTVGAILETLATVGLVISGLGIYAGFATIVTRRRHELGVRMSLGATPADMLRWVLLRAAWVFAGGYVVGTALAVAGSRLVQAFHLIDAGPRNPHVHAAALVLTALLAVAASLTPALRAARTDPVSSLRAS